MLRRLRQQSPGVPVVVGEGERIPLQDNSVDLVTCATAWHWLDAELAVAAVRRVARAGGHLALWWANHRFGDGIAWEEAQGEIMARYELVRGSRASSPRAIGVDDAADGLRALGLHVVVDTELHWTRTVSRETHVQTIATHSNRIMLPPELRQQVLDDISEVLQPWPVVEQRLRGPVVVAEI
jgi:SAM-dependent methyltransferase